MALFNWLRRKAGASSDKDFQNSSLFSRLEADSRYGSAYASTPPDGREGRKSANSVFPDSQGGELTPAARLSVRRNLIRMCLRDVLLKVGIPTEWVTAEVLIASSRTGATGLHLRLRIKRWDERLPGVTLTLQRQFEQRVASLDPLAPEWLNGISWQYALGEEPELPKLPHPSAWTRTKPAETAAPVIAGPSGVPLFKSPVVPMRKDGGAADPSARED